MYFEKFHFYLSTEVEDLNLISEAGVFVFQV